MYVEGNPVSSIDPFGLQRAPRRGSSGPTFEPTIAEIFAARDVVNLTNQIRQSNPAFNYAILARPGYRYNRQDVDFLRDILRQEQQSLSCPVGATPPRTDFGRTPAGTNLTMHYSAETGPTRNVPGSVIDSVISISTPGISPRNGAKVYYDSANNVTVVTGRGGIMSSHVGPPNEKFP